MGKFTKREKILTTFVVILAVVVISLMTMVSGSKLLSILFPHEPSSPPTIEESIKNSDAIFSCFYEDSGKFIECKINKIFHVRKGYNFPHNVGDYYPENKQNKDPEVSYGEGAIVFINPRNGTSYYSTTIDHGKLIGHGSIYYDSFEHFMQEHLE